MLLASFLVFLGAIVIFRLGYSWGDTVVGDQDLVVED
jgi:hypothetical protein